MKTHSSLIVIFCIFCVPAFAVTTVSVNCSGGAADYPSIGAAIAALKILPVSGNAVLNVTGVCNENVVIDNFAELTLNGQSGAAITSPNSNAAIRIDHSKKVIVRGFAIRGGSPAVLVRRGAGIVVDSCNVGTALAKGPGSGIRYEEQAMGHVVNTSVNNFTGAGIVAMYGSVVFVQSSVPSSISNSVAGIHVSILSSVTVSGKITVENNTGTGLAAALNSTLFVTNCNAGEVAIRNNNTGVGSVNSTLSISCPALIENNSFIGVHQSSGGSAALYNATIRNNGSGAGGYGVLLDGASFLLFGTQILNNLGPGIAVRRASNGYAQQLTVAGNAADGIRISQGSVVEFAATNSVSGHPGADLLCNTGANAFGSKTGMGKLVCPGFGSESGPKPFAPEIP